LSPLVNPASPACAASEPHRRILRSHQRHVRCTCARCSLAQARLSGGIRCCLSKWLNEDCSSRPAPHGHAVCCARAAAGTCVGGGGRAGGGGVSALPRHAPPPPRPHCRRAPCPHHRRRPARPPLTRPQPP
ncbi:unnamed protein product, partial [Closterium sp. NIES-65]